MKINEFKEVAKGQRKAVNDISNMYLTDAIDEVVETFKVNKTVAKYLLCKVLRYNLVRAEIENQVNFLDENDLIFEDD